MNTDDWNDSEKKIQMNVASLEEHVERVCFEIDYLSDA